MRSSQWIELANALLPTGLQEHLGVGLIGLALVCAWYGVVWDGISGMRWYLMRLEWRIRCDGWGRSDWMPWCCWDGVD